MFIKASHAFILHIRTHYLSWSATVGMYEERLKVSVVIPF